MTVTVLTPTYNRGKLLSVCHDSLCKQSDKNFEWIIVDDGSTDDTERKVKSWMTDIVSICDYTLSGRSLQGGFDILYIQQSNRGKHCALNYGIKKARGQLTLILDSDDYLSINCIELLIDKFENIKNDMLIGGIGARKAHFDGRLVGNIRQETIVTSYLDYRYKLCVKGDMCEVYLTRVMREFSFPEIEGEKFCPEALIWNRISTKYKLLYIPDVVYHCEYLKDGLSNHITKIRMDSPVASMITYAELTTYDIPFLQKAKAAINYHRFALCRDPKRPIRGIDMNKPVKLPTISRWWFWTKPLGWALHKRDMKNK